jgi:AAA ATPase-like protein
VQVRRFKIQNFRGVADGVVTLAGHALLVGGNNIGKSTVCEALDLVLGPERVYRRPVVDEHDFHNGHYIGDNDTPIDIRIEAVLTDLSEEAQLRFRAHLRRWNDKTCAFVDDTPNGAFETVLRACGFGSLAIFCIMIGLSFEPRISFQTGGTLTLLMAGVLILKAREARTKPYGRTEMWLYLPKDLRPPAASAQQMTSAVMRETYLMFAYWTSGVAAGMWLLALVFSLLGS